MMDPSGRGISTEPVIRRSRGPEGALAADGQARACLTVAPPIASFGTQVCLTKCEKRF